MSSPILHFYRLIFFLVSLSLFSTIYLYRYPVFHGCAFLSPGASPSSSFLRTVEQHIVRRSDPNSVTAPFRLLVFGDPQLEGDSSLEEIQWSSSPLEWLRPSIQSLRKRLDLIGNDYYLAHIYRALRWWTKPTHIAVLGDLLGSQWVTDDEFHHRASRFWERVFRGTYKVEDDIVEGDSVEFLGKDEQWQHRIINVAGNHDVGYAGDMISPRITRFEDAFGKANRVVRFQLQLNQSSGGSHDDDDNDSVHARPELRLVVLNSLNLDGPVIESDLQRQTYDFVNHVILTSRPVEDQAAATVLLTHLPLHKEAGVCVDGPFIAYNSDFFGGGIKEQNHLSSQSSKAVLEGIFGMSGNTQAPNSGLGRPGIILTGHDHEGCDVYHYIPPAVAGVDPKERRWNASRWPDSTTIAGDEAVPGIREVTVRSMMGEFGGNAGLLSAWYDEDDEKGPWRFKYASCKLGVQHIWWAIHALDMVTFLCLLVLFAFFVASNRPALFGPSNQRESWREAPAQRLNKVKKTSLNERNRPRSTALAVNGPSPTRRGSGIGNRPSKRK